MNDLYLKLATSQVGKSLFQALNLPKPISLLRTPNISLSSPTGRVLIAGTKNNFAFKMITKSLNVESIKLAYPKSNTSPQLFVQPAPSCHAEQVNLSKKDSKHYKAIVFDATGLSSPEELSLLFHFFQPTLSKIKTNGKVVIVGLLPESADKPEQSATHSALIGFIKSASKEIGKKGATCNLLMLEKGAERNIKAALYYLLTEKSSFVTGQTLTLKNSSVRPNKINWESPLRGKTAIVTGAAHGIGQETARVLSRDGACVICLDMPTNKAQLKKLAAEIGGHSLTLDLSDEDAPQKILNIIRSQLGVIDILVHNAGITRDKTLAKMPEHFWNQVINVNLSVVTKINELLLENKALSPKARIICISSISGIAGNFGQTNYACSKAGITGYVRAMARASNNDFTINAIAPGFIETRMTSQIPFITREFGRRMNTLSQGGLTLDIAESISFFCHPSSHALNGNVLRVCGQNILGA